MAAKQGRDSLDALSKDELVARAETLGIDGARKFTKVELIDEITRATGNGADRGLLGRARDLLRGVVEKGLTRSSPPPRTNGDHIDHNLLAPTPSSPASPRAEKIDTTPEPPVPTVTLAEIYVGQGHVARAKAIVREVLRNDEGDAAARALLDKLEQDSKPVAPAMKVEKGALPDDPYSRVGIEREAFVEPSAVPRRDVPSMLDDAPFPARYDVDECVAMAVDPTTVYVYWESRGATVARARRALSRTTSVDAASVLRVLVVEPHERGPRVSTRDFAIVDLELGEWFVKDLPGGAIVRAAIGLKSGDRFLPVAHTADVEAPVNKPGEAYAYDVVVWSEGETRPRATPRAPLPALGRIAREAGTLGTLGLPPLPEPPDDEITAGRGMSSAELARRARVVRARREGRPESPATGSSDLLAAPGSASWLAR